MEVAAPARPSAPAQQVSGESPASPSARGAPRTPARRPRARRSFFGPRTGTTDPLLAPLLETISSVSPKESLSLVQRDRKSTRLNSSHVAVSYAGFCLT